MLLEHFIAQKIAEESSENLVLKAVLLGGQCFWCAVVRVHQERPKMHKKLRKLTYE